MKQSITISALVLAAFTGCALGDSGTRELDEVSFATQAVVVSSGTRVPLPIQRIYKASTGSISTVVDSLTGNPKSAWSASYSELLMADAYAQCVAETVGLEQPVFYNGYSGWPDIAQQSVNGETALHRMVAAMTANPCARTEYTARDSAGAMVFPEDAIEWAYRRSDPTCNRDGATGEAVAAFTLPSLDVNSPVQDYLTRQPFASFVFEDTTNSTQFGAFDFIYRAHVNLCLADRIHSLLERINVFETTTQEHTLLLGQAYERAQDAMMRLGYLLKYHQRSGADMPWTNRDGNAAGAYLRIWLLTASSAVVDQVRGKFLHSLHLTNSGATALARYFERQAGARWTTVASPSAFGRDWAAGSARSRLMNLVYGGGTHKDLWGDSTGLWEIPWFADLGEQSEDPELMIMLALARRSDALWIRAVPSSNPVVMDSKSGEELYRETEVGIRVRECQSANPVECTPDAIRTALPAAGTDAGFRLRDGYGVTLRHARILAARLFDGAVSQDMIFRSPTQKAKTQWGRFHFTGNHDVLTHTDHSGATEEWLRLDNSGVLMPYAFDDWADGGWSVCSPSEPNWDSPLLCNSNQIHTQYYEEPERIGVVSALAFAREVLFQQAAVVSTATGTAAIGEALDAVKMLVGSTTTIRRQSSVDAVRTPGASEVTLVQTTNCWGSRGLQAAAKDRYFAAGSGCSRAALDLIAGESGTDTSGTGAADGYTLTQWPSSYSSNALALLERYVDNGRTKYTFLSRNPLNVGFGNPLPDAAVATDGWFVDLVSRITAVQDNDWTRPRYDGFGLPVKWVPPADASLMGGTANEESYQYLLRTAKSAAEEATSAVKTAIDRLVAEETDDAALQEAETKAQAIGNLEQKSLCGETNSCKVQNKSTSFEQENVDGTCSVVPSAGITSCKAALRKANDALSSSSIPQVVADKLNSASVTFSEEAYEGSELQRVLLRMWSAARVLGSSRDKAKEEAIAYGAEIGAADAAIGASTSEYDAVMVKLHNLSQDIVAKEATRAIQVDALTATLTTAEEKVQAAGIYVHKYCAGDVAVSCTFNCTNWSTSCNRNCVEGIPSEDARVTYDACVDDNVEGCGIGAASNFGQSDNNVPCMDALANYRVALASQAETGAAVGAQFEILAHDGFVEEQKQIELERVAALHKRQSTQLAYGARKSAAWTQVVSHVGIIRQLKGELQASLAELKQLQLRSGQSTARARLEVQMASKSYSQKAGIRRKYRSYDMWRARALLENARRLAVSARRSIEARFVVDLSTLQSEQAFVASPAAWADEVFESDLNAPEAVGLSQAPKIEGAIYPNKLVDYVGNLERFVQGYTITYPTSVSLPDTEVLTFGGPEQVDVTESAGVKSTWLSSSTSGWRFYCTEQGKWLAHPGAGEYPLVHRLETVCNGRKPALAKIGFWLDPWGTVNGSVARPRYVDRHNVRWRRLAVNLVGTGIRDCSQSSDQMNCYTNPYVRFNLIQAGPSWQTNHAGEWRSIDIPTAHIESGKALSAEEWLEPTSNSWNMPYVSAVARGELFGRPAAGNYELVFEISSDVRLDRIERVQLLIEQDYWVRQTGGRGVYEDPSRIPTSFGSGGSTGATSTTSGGSGTTSGGSSSGGASGLGGSTAAGGTTSTAYTGDCTPYGTDLLIENFNDGNKLIDSNARRLGAWYGFHAGTCSASPPTTASFVPSPGTNGGGYMGHADGTGCTFTGTPSWSGGGIGFNFLSSYVNGIETVCANYNASSYTGIAFDAQGSGQIRLEVCTSDHADPDNADCHGAYFTISSTWTRYQARWVNLSQRGWGTAVTFNSSHLRKLQFLSTDANYSFNVDNISFINN